MKRIYFAALGLLILAVVLHIVFCHKPGQSLVKPASVDWLAMILKPPAAVGSGKVTIVTDTRELDRLNGEVARLIRERDNAMTGWEQLTERYLELAMEVAEMDSTAALKLAELAPMVAVHRHPNGYIEVVTLPDTFHVGRSRVYCDRTSWSLYAGKVTPRLVTRRFPIDFGVSAWGGGYCDGRNAAELLKLGVGARVLIGSQRVHGYAGASYWPWRDGLRVEAGLEGMAWF